MYRTSRNAIRKFRALVRSFYRRGGRHTLPWRKTHNSYRILVSEIMLQQTQVSRALLFYPKFLKRFPTFSALARASRRTVLRMWQGLGYNRRAVALHRIAKTVLKEHKGKLPRDSESLERLPGIGRATAGAILAFAFNRSIPFVETNIRRAFMHHFFREGRSVTEEEILKLAGAILPKNPRPVRSGSPRGGRSRAAGRAASNGAREWYYALMDYGAWLAKETENPNRRHAQYRRQPQFTGSSRELRGKIVRYLLAHPRTTAQGLARILKEPLPRVEKILAALKREHIL